MRIVAGSGSQRWRWVATQTGHGVRRGGRFATEREAMAAAARMGAVRVHRMVDARRAAGSLEHTDGPDAAARVMGALGLAATEASA